MLYGGITAGKNGSVLPDPEVYYMKLQGGEYLLLLNLFLLNSIRTHKQIQIKLGSKI